MKGLKNVVKTLQIKLKFQSDRTYKPICDKNNDFGQINR